MTPTTSEIVHVLAAYAASSLIVTGLIAWVLFERRRLTRAIARLEAQSGEPRAGGSGR